MIKFNIEQSNIDTHLDSLLGILPFDSVDVYTNQMNQINIEFSKLIRESYSVVRIFHEENLYEGVSVNKIPKEIKEISTNLYGTNEGKVEIRNPSLSREINETYAKIINLLSKGKKSFLSNWVLTNKYNKKFLPAWYQGEILRRSDGQLTFFVEWTEGIDLITYHSFWNYGTWGFIMNCSKDKFRYWTHISENGENLVDNFLNDMYLAFILIGEADELLILVNDQDYGYVVEKINEILKIFK